MKNIRFGPGPFAFDSLSAVFVPAGMRAPDQGPITDPASLASALKRGATWSPDAPAGVALFLP